MSCVSSIFNQQEVLALVDGNRELLRELIDLFLDLTPKQWAEMTACMANNDLNGVRRVAHTLKGSTATFRSATVVASLERLEAAGAAMNRAAVKTAFQDAERLLGELVAALKEFIKE